jgi:putative transposase
MYNSGEQPAEQWHGRTFRDLTMKEDYIAFMPKPDVRTALRNLAAAFTHYNENHPHSAGISLSREYRRQRASLT